MRRAHRERIAVGAHRQRDANEWISDPEAVVLAGIRHLQIPYRGRLSRAEIDARRLLAHANGDGIPADSGCQRKIGAYPGLHSFS